MDPAVLVALLALIGVLATAVTTVVVALITNRKEKVTSAESSMERTLRERITLRDEQIADLKHDILERDERLAECEAENDRLRLAQDENRAEEREHLDGHH